MIRGQGGDVERMVGPRKFCPAGRNYFRSLNHEDFVQFFKQSRVMEKLGFTESGNELKKVTCILRESARM
jgi:hypothetical protein